MILNFFSMSYVYYLMEWTDMPCFNDPVLVYVGLFVFGLFTTLFVNFFVQNYIKGKRRARQARLDAATAATAAEAKAKEANEANGSTKSG